MANPEMGLLSKIIRHDALRQVMKWGLRDTDFLTDEGRAIYQHMQMMIRDPRFKGSTPGLNVMGTLYPNFDMCDDAAMSLEAYCVMVRENKLGVEMQDAIRAALATDGDPLQKTMGLLERLRRNVLDVGISNTSTLVAAAAFATQPNDDDLRKQLVIPDLLIGPGAPTLLVAPGFAGKTALAQALGLAIATGQPAWGLFPTKQGRVLHVDAEQQAAVTEQRYRQLARGMGIDLAKVTTLDVRYKPPALVRVGERGRAVLNEVEWLEMVRGYQLVIADSLAALTLGILQENSSEIRSVLDMLSRVSEETGAAFIVLHHTTKQRPQGTQGRASIRGSGAIFEAASVVLMVEKAGDDTVSITNEKARGGLNADPVPAFRVIKKRVGPDAYIEAAERGHSTAGPRPSPLEGRCQRITRVLEEVGGTITSQDELRKRCGIGSSPFKQARDKLVAEGKLAVSRGRIALTEPSPDVARAPVRVRAQPPIPRAMIPASTALRRPEPHFAFPRRA